MSGLDRIRDERMRQMRKWTAAHDDEHTDGELAVMAAGLCLTAVKPEKMEPTDDAWGLMEKHKDNPVRLLTIAGALIAAEIDRLEREA